MLCAEIVSDIQNNLCTQHVLPMFCKKISFWQRFTCSWRQFSSQCFCKLISSILVNKRNHPGYAIAILMPVIVCLLFTANQWRKNETGTRDRLASLLFLLAMLYPPFVAARLIYFLIKKDRRWLEAKRNYDTNISSIGKLKIWKKFYSARQSIYKYFYLIWVKLC